MAKDKAALPAYESVLVMAPDMSKEQQKTLFQRVKQIISQFKGDIYHIDSWGLRKLANRNKKSHAQGLYFHFSFTGQPGVTAELTRIIKMQEQSIYHHFEKLPDKLSLKEHLERWRQTVENSIKKEKERQARLLQRKKLNPAFSSSRSKPDRGAMTDTPRASSTPAPFSSTGKLEKTDRIERT